jgi:hypothetical protein
MSWPPPKASRTRAGLPDARGEHPTSTPMSVLQDLYNRWKDLEEGLTFGDMLEIHNGESDSGTANLAAPSDSNTASSMSRSTSQTSAYSLTRDIANIRIGDRHHYQPYPDVVDQPNKHKAGRKPGPLQPTLRAKTAFMRKMKACPHCHAKKIAVCNLCNPHGRPC